MWERVSLELASTDDLLKELFSRYDHCVFGGLKVRPTAEDPLNMIRSWRTRGCIEMCQGVCSGLIARLQQLSDDNFLPMDVSEL